MARALMEAPHLHAHAVFIELTFGLNSAFSIYKEFYDLLEGRIDKKIKELIAKVNTIEGASRDGSQARRDAVENQLRKIKDSHVRVRAGLYRPTIYLAISCAAAALMVLYADWIEMMGWWCGLLTAPILFDLAIAILNYQIFCRRGVRKVRRLAMLHNEFDPPSPVPRPPTDVG